MNKTDDVIITKFISSIIIFVELDYLYNTLSSTVNLKLSHKK